MDLLSSLRRHWILTSLLLIMMLVGTVGVFFKLPSTFQAQSSVVFLISKNQLKSFGGNPYLAFSSTLNQTADVVRYETMDVSTVSSLAAEGYTSTYLISDAIDTSGPVLIITVTGHSKSEVERTLYGVTRAIGTNLDKIQANLPSASKIRVIQITFQPTPIALTSKKMRPLFVVVGLGLVLTIGIPLIVDAMLVRRRGQAVASGRNRRDRRAVPRSASISPARSHWRADPPEEARHRPHPEQAPRQPARRR